MYGMFVVSLCTTLKTTVTTTKKLYTQRKIGDKSELEKDQASYNIDGYGYTMMQEPCRQIE